VYVCECECECLFLFVFVSVWFSVCACNVFLPLSLVKNFISATGIGLAIQSLFCWWVNLRAQVVPVRPCQR
jgi:hypothetical protein